MSVEHGEIGRSGVSVKNGVGEEARGHGKISRMMEMAESMR